MKVLITGGTRGIGLAAAERFYEAGYDVAVLGRNFQNISHRSFRKVPFDLSNISAIPQLFQTLGEIDILVNNAGIDTKSDFLDYSEEQIERILNINLRAPLELMNAAIRGFRERGRGGRIVNVASQAGEVGHTDVWYGMTKAALINATKSYVSIVGKEGIVINAVAPGPVGTEMIRNSIYNSRFESVRRRTYTERFAEPEEIAEVIFWLATASPVYLNGEVINLNNGAQRIKSE
ncbi:MAG: SDR family oxidoreductase [Clostridiales bacterium]|nr:SDR family oxidoreductase [Clostridiales bacterium]